MTTMTASSDEKINVNSKLTKRQRHKKGPNPANTWAQHPGIKSSAARTRAYLIDAGLTKSKKISKDALDPQLDLDSPEVKIGRMLGSTNQQVRHKAVQKLEVYLKARSDISNLKGGFSELDFLKLWKGLWYTLYMADKVPVQDELSKRLAELMWSMCGTEEEDEYAGQVYLNMDEKDQQDFSKTYDQQDCSCESNDDEVSMEEIENAIEEERQAGFDEDDEEMEEGDEGDEDMDSETEGTDDSLVKHCRGAHLVALYVRTFFRTVRREWANMDKYRIDKFYTAIRYMMAQVYKYMAKRHWNLGIIRLFNDTIFEEVLAPRDTLNVSNGLRYHLIDITLVELAKVNKESATLPLTEATLLDCLEPYFALAQKIDDATVHKRVMENVVERFLLQYSVVSENMEKDEEEEARQLVMDQVHVGSVAQFIFQVASDEATNDRYRKSLYDAHKYFSRLVKETGRDIDLSQPDEDDVEEEPEPIDSEGDDNKENTENAIQNQITNFVKEEEQGSEKVTGVKENIEEIQKGEVKSKKESKKKKSKKKKHHEKSKNKEDHKEETATANSKKILDSSGKQNKGQDTGEEEEVITITKKEQKKAARAARKAAEEEAVTFSTPKTSKEKKNERSPPSVNPHSMTDSDAVHSDVDNSKSTSQNSEKRRVKFGKMNFSKSYKASMRDLKTIENRVDLSRTPDKSILLCKRPSPIDEDALEKAKNAEKRKRKKRAVEKDSTCVRRSTRKTRKKASDYFTTN